jgi:exopolysaccharide biosynthesis polyprenyl glycosylphosphotransferase
MTQTTQAPPAAISGRAHGAVDLRVRRSRLHAAAGWQRRYVRRLVIGDAIALSGATATAVFLQSLRGQDHLAGSSYAGLATLLAVSWMAALSAGRAYEPRFLGCGSEEYKRVANASMHLIAAVALVAFALRLAPARSFVGLAIVFGTATVLVHRYAARRVLYRDRLNGRSSHRVLAVGDSSTLTSLLDAVEREPKAGFNVVGVCTPQSSEAILSQVDQLGVDVIAVTASAGLGPDFLRTLAWELEGRGVDLIVAPALTDVAGPRIAIRPVAGLPLLHVDQPDITGARYLFKEILERAVALAILLATLPLLLAIAVAIKLTSSGPVLFRQERMRRHGKSFRMLKFRSMHVGADDIVDQFHEQNDMVDGLLFKMRDDPRVTAVGRFLRRWSVDELPQLLNVLRGDMALVGPRPPLPREVAAYTDRVHRRLLVKPGMTGLWQVSGRSDLSWDETVRLDLYYVENWSLSLDLQILWRTMAAVVSSAGAY